MDNANIVLYLLRKGVQFEVLDTNNESVFHRAISQEWTSVLTYLVQHLPSIPTASFINAKNKQNGDTCLHLAMSYKLPWVAEYLVNTCKADTALLNNNKEVAAQKFSSSSFIENCMVEQLLGKRKLEQDEEEDDEKPAKKKQRRKK